MKKLILPLLVSVVLAGCGDEKTPEQIKYEQEKEMLLIKQAHEREMARIAVREAEAQHQPIQVEEEYYEEPQQPVQTYARSYNQQQEVATQVQTVQPQQTYPEPTQTQETSEGYSGTSMLMSAAGGAIAGYMMGELLDNGMKSYTDDSGKTHYVDGKSGKPITKEQYETAKKTSKVTQFKERSKEVGTKIVDKTKQGIDTTKAKVSEFKQSEKGQKIQQKVTATKDAAKYQARKVKVVAKKQYKQVKQKVGKKK